MNEEEIKKKAKEYAVAFCAVLDEGRDDPAHEYWAMCALSAEMFSASVLRCIALNTEVDEDELLTLFVRALDSRMRD